MSLGSEVWGLGLWGLESGVRGLGFGVWSLGSGSLGSDLRHGQSGCE